MTSYFKGTDSGVKPIHWAINVPKRPFLAAPHELKTLTAHSVFFSVFLGIYPLAYSAASASETVVLKRFRGCKGLHNFFEGSKSSSGSFIA